MRFVAGVDWSDEAFAAVEQDVRGDDRPPLSRRSTYTPRHLGQFLAQSVFRMAHRRRIHVKTMEHAATIQGLAKGSTRKVIQFPALIAVKAVANRSTSAVKGR